MLPSPAIPVGRRAVERLGTGRRSDRGRRGRRIARAADTKDPPLATRTELSEFLAGVERRAYKQALFAVRDDEGALDIVQDAMMRLAEKYGGKPAAELPLLFQRILQNAIRDWFRRSKVRSFWTTLFSSLTPDDDDAHDPLETLEAADESNRNETPHGNFEQAQTMAIIEEEVSKLPARQREAFLMRYWEDFDVAETAAAMGCSEGSVKTHYSRAVHTLRELLEDHWP